MYRNKIDEKIEESAISTAAAEMMEIKGRKLWEEYGKMDKRFPAAPDEKHRSEFEAALDRAYRCERIKTFFKGLIKPAKYAVTSLAALIVIFSFSVVSVDAVRIKFIDWLMSFHNSHTVTNSINGYDKNVVDYNSFWSDANAVNILPDGYSFKSAILEKQIMTISYESNNYFITIMEYPIDQTVSIDNENPGAIDYIVINGFDGVLVKKEDIMSIVWHTEEKTYVTFTNDSSISKKQFIEIAEVLSK